MAEQSHQLVHRQRNDALSQMLALCSTPSEITLVKELYVSAANAKTELDPHLTQEFLREFASLSADALAAAFRGWRSHSRFQPSVADIWEELGLHHERRVIELADADRRKDKAETARRLAAGENMLSGEELSELNTALLSTIKLMPETKKAPRRSRIVSAIEAPAPDQLRDRVATSKARLKQYLIDKKVSPKKWPAEFRQRSRA